MIKGFEGQASCCYCMVEAFSEICVLWSFEKMLSENKQDQSGTVGTVHFRLLKFLPVVKEKVQLDV